MHNSFSRSSPFADETKRLAAEEDEEVYHFIAYAPINGVLYELDGLQPAPISHGRCEPGGFPAAVVPVLRRRIARYPDAEIRFNLLAVVRDGRKRAEEAGDVHALQQERDRRDAWRWENALRRHNFVGFIGELTKAVVGQKVAEGGQAYENWLDDARSKTQERLKRGRSGSAAAADIA